MKPRLPFRVLWIAWAIIALAVAIPLATARGHPPGFVFLPVVAAAWLVGHLLILGLARFASRLAASRPEGLMTAGARPVAQWIAGVLIAIALLVATGFALFMVGSVSIGHAGMLGGIVVAATVGAWALLGALLAGLVARRAWAVPAVRWTLVASELWWAWMLVAGALDKRLGIAAMGLAGLVLTGWLIFALRPRTAKNGDAPLFR